MVHERFERCVKSLDSCVADVTAMFFLQALPPIGQYQFVFALLARMGTGWFDDSKLETRVINVKNSILPACVVSFLSDISERNNDYSDTFDFRRG